jgi:hypothetical protein
MSCAVIPARHGDVDHPAKKHWEEGPQEPQESDEENPEDQGVVGFGMGKEGPQEPKDKRNADEHKDNTPKYLCEQGKHLPDGRDLGLRDGEISAPTLGACFGNPRVYMEFRAELHVIAPPAGIAEQRFSSRGMATRVAKLHDGFWN